MEADEPEPTQEEDQTEQMEDRGQGGEKEKDEKQVCFVFREPFLELSVLLLFKYFFRTLRVDEKQMKRMNSRKKRRERGRGCLSYHYKRG